LRLNVLDGLDIVISELRDGYPWMRANAAQALTRVDDVRIDSALELALSDEIPEVSEAARAALEVRRT
jgi:hypothetical protein